MSPATSLATVRKGICDVVKAVGYLCDQPFNENFQENATFLKVLGDVLLSVLSLSTMICVSFIII